VGFEHMIPASDGAKAVHALVSSATVTGYLYLHLNDICHIMSSEAILMINIYLLLVLDNIYCFIQLNTFHRKQCGSFIMSHYTCVGSVVNLVLSGYEDCCACN
jgi:hypothetical protein